MKQVVLNKSGSSVTIEALQGDILTALAMELNYPGIHKEVLLAKPEVLLPEKITVGQFPFSHITRRSIPGDVAHMDLGFRYGILLGSFSDKQVYSAYPETYPQIYYVDKVAEKLGIAIPPQLACLEGLEAAIVAESLKVKGIWLEELETGYKTFTIDMIRG